MKSQLILIEDEMTKNKIGMSRQWIILISSKRRLKNDNNLSLSLKKKRVKDKTNYETKKTNSGDNHIKQIK
jgi:hypothetical protein